MQKIIELLKQHKDVAFATIGTDNAPKVRIFQVMLYGEKELFFATAKSKEVYQELLQNNKVEIVSLIKNVSVRISGEVYFDHNRETEKAIFDSNPILEQIYHNFENEALVYFRLKIEKAELYDLRELSPEREFFEFN